MLLVAVLEHTREPWRILAEARRVLKPGGRAIMVVPNDVTMSAGRLLLRKFPIRYPDHLTLTTPRRMRRWLCDGFRISRGVSLAVPATSVCREPVPLRRRREDDGRREGLALPWRTSRRSSSSAPARRYVGGLAAVGARHPGDGAREGHRRRRDGQDDHGRPLPVDYGPHTFHIRETEESRAIHEAIRPFFGDDPLILTRGTRVLLRGKEYVYPLEMLQVLTGVSPLLSARIIFDYLIAT